MVARDCWATLALDEESFTRLMGFRSRYAVVDLKDWSFPTALMPFKPHVRARVSGSGTVDFTHEYGQIVVALSATLDQGNEEVQSFEIRSEAENSESTLAGEAELTQESVSGDEKTSFPKIFYEYDWTEHTTHIWLDEIDVQALFELLASVLSSDEASKKWFENLGAQGAARSTSITNRKRQCHADGGWQGNVDRRVSRRAFREARGSCNKRFSIEFTLRSVTSGRACCCR